MFMPTDAFPAVQSSESSTFNGRRPGFDIQYAGIGSRVEGYYFCDNLAVGGATIKNLTMAVASVVQDEASGVLGIGFDTNELAAFDGQHIYSNLIDEMVGQHLISSRTYSLWLDDIGTFCNPIPFQSAEAYLKHSLIHGHYSIRRLRHIKIPSATDRLAHGSQP